MQADYKTKYSQVRKLQYTEIYNQRIIPHEKKVIPTILLGDLNINQPDKHEAILQIAKKNNIVINEGTYTFTTGPTYETQAEIKEIIDLGGDAVGMSTFPEFITSKKLNLNSIFISCLTNYGAGLIDGKITHEDVLFNAKKAKINFCKLISEIIKNISKNWGTKKN